MEHLTDWNCRCMPAMRERLSKPEETLEVLHFLNRRYGFSGFCMMPDYDAAREPVSVFLLRLSHSQELMSSLGSIPYQIRFAPRALLIPNLHLCEGLEQLISFGSYLPLHLPASSYADYIDYELNRLLYKRKLKLFFTSFELATLFYPWEIIEKLMHIPNAVFQFGYSALSDPTAVRAMKLLLQQNGILLLGTSTDCLARAYRQALSDCEKPATEVLSVAGYQKVLLNSRRFWDL